MDVNSVDVEKKQVEMSFRSGDRSVWPEAQLKLSDISEGQKVDGRVKKVEDYGLFIKIEGSKLSGLCHKSQVRRRALYDGSSAQSIHISSLIIRMRMLL